MGFDSRSGVNKIYSAELSYTLCVLSEVSAIGLPDKICLLELPLSIQLPGVKLGSLNYFVTVFVH